MRLPVRGVLLELLPLDEERRNRHLVYVAYFVRFLDDPALEKLVAELLSSITSSTASSRPRSHNRARTDADRLASRHSGDRQRGRLDSFRTHRDFSSPSGDSEVS